jgi:hypothetical protein
MTNHQCEVKVATQASVKDKEMEVDGNKETRANKQKVKGNQIPPKTKEGLLNAILAHL